MPDFLVTRSATIPAPIEKARALIRDLHCWEAWSPWQELDPQMMQRYSGAPAGVGAVMEWSGNRHAGSGRMTVVTDEPLLTEVDLEFHKPFKAVNRSRFELQPLGENATHVIWAMTGKQNAFMRLMFKVLRVEKTIGADFERGLNRLAQAAEHT